MKLPDEEIGSRIDKLRELYIRFEEHYSTIDPKWFEDSANKEVFALAKIAHTYLGDLQDGTTELVKGVLDAPALSIPRDDLVRLARKFLLVPGYVSTKPLEAAGQAQRAQLKLRELIAKELPAIKALFLDLPLDVQKALDVLLPPLRGEA